MEGSERLAWLGFISDGGALRTQGQWTGTTTRVHSHSLKALFVKLRQNGLNETFEKHAASFMQQIVVEPKDK